VYVHAAEFSAPDGVVVVPHWQLRALGLAPGDVVEASVAQVPNPRASSEAR
jgi:hypothetical protein